MNMTENANLIEGLRVTGFTDTQITDLMLMIAGHIDMEEWKRRFEQEKNKCD